MTADTRKLRPRTAVVYGAVLGLCGTATAQIYKPAIYAFPYQAQFGAPATFYVSGPATGPLADREADAFLDLVLYPSGDERIFLYRPIDVDDVVYVSDPTMLSVRGGWSTTVGLRGSFPIGSLDGNPGNLTQGDRDLFGPLALVALASSNLNNYVDVSADGPLFHLTIEFDTFVKDNDPAPDDFGELIYMERGTGKASVTDGGNSWIKFQAVDVNGVALGPWLVVSPAETADTTPITILNSDQKLGATAIDVSRLGVTEFKYLRVSNDVVGEAAYDPSGDGDRNPDFRLMAVIVDERQIAVEASHD